MTLVVATVVGVGLLITALAVFLFMIGILLKQTAAYLRDCLDSVRTIAGQAQVIGPGVTRLNATAGELLGAMPLLTEGADGVTAKLAPSVATSPAPTAAPAASAAVGTPAHSGSGVAASQAVRTGGGYVEPPPGVGYLDV
jgi:hypothetical protein